MRGSAPERSCGQGVPRVNRTVQTRVVLDAIVSTKTFGNATSANRQLAKISCNFPCRSCGTFKIFEPYLPIVCFTRNDKRAEEEHISKNPYFCPFLFSLTVTSVMLERMEKFKHFFTTFLGGAFARVRVVVS
jgi:hypothetical protein